MRYKKSPVPSMDEMIISFIRSVIRDSPIMNADNAPGGDKRDG